MMPLPSRPPLPTPFLASRTPCCRCCTDPYAPRVELFATFGIKGASSNQQLVQDSDIIFLAVKPQYVHTVIAECEHLWTSEKLVVSIAAGVTIGAMEVRLRLTVLPSYP